MHRKDDDEYPDNLANKRDNNIYMTGWTGGKILMTIYEAQAIGLTKAQILNFYRQDEQFKKIADQVGRTPALFFTYRKDGSMFYGGQIEKSSTRSMQFDSNNNLIYWQDYRNGVNWYHFDPSKWIIKILSLFKITYALRKVPDYLIAKAEIDTLNKKINFLLQSINSKKGLYK